MVELNATMSRVAERDARQPVSSAPPKFRIGKLAQQQWQRGDAAYAFSFVKCERLVEVGIASYRRSGEDALGLGSSTETPTPSSWRVYKDLSHPIEVALAGK